MNRYGDNKISMSWYEQRVLPYLLNLACGIRSVRRQREKIVPLAYGRVLEVGIGTGLNIPHYNKSRVSKITGVDPALRLHQLVRRRIDRTGLNVELIGQFAEKLPLDDASFDSILITYTLCSIADPVAALREMRRVLVPGGKLFFCEHGSAPDDAVRRWQARLQPLWSRISGGCHLNRDIPILLQQAGFKVLSIESMYLKGPRLFTYNYRGEAVAL